jgi:xanthine/CO dehydrogenase XdhC/CoxF family maturation factor
MTHIRGQTFDGNETARRGLRRRNLTGAQRFPVFKDCARSANSNAATKFGAGQTKVVPKQPKQRSIIVRFDSASHAIHSEVKLAHIGLIIATLVETEDFALPFKIPSDKKEWIPAMAIQSGFQLRSLINELKLFFNVKDLYDIVHEWRANRGERHALATLVHVEGSSYRRPGARMSICQTGQRVGSLSAGCLEEEVVQRARDVLRTSEPALMTFDTRKRFGCAGTINIFIERASDNFFADLAMQLDARRSCLAITRLAGENLGSRIVPFCNEPKREDEFVQQIHPPIQLCIIGDGLDSTPFHSLGQSLGWRTLEVTDAAQLALVPDEWTAAVVKSHNYGRDFAALQKLLPLGLRYVGLIGPRKRRNQLLSDLLELGVTINAGFFAPAGLDLGAETPEEIALAIVSEIQRVFAAASGESLRERRTPIHGSITGMALT